MHCIEDFHRSVLCCKCIVWCWYTTLCPGLKKGGLFAFVANRKVGDFRIHRKGKLWHHKQKGSLNYSKQCLSLVLTYWINCLSVSKLHLPVSSMLSLLICCLRLLGWPGGVTTAGPKRMTNQKTSADAFDNSSISEISAKKHSPARASTQDHICNEMTWEPFLLLYDCWDQCTHPLWWMLGWTLKTNRCIQ